MSNWNLIDERVQDGFTIRLYEQPEEDAPEGHFASGDDQADKDLCNKIRDGIYEWFMVKCDAVKDGVTLGTDHLGGCCYSSFQEFVTEDGYYANMRTNAIEEAKRQLTRFLTAKT